MKKPYEKPVLLIEKYALTQQIASCATNIGFGDAQCVIDDEDSTGQMKDFASWGTFTSVCDIPATVGQEFDGLCYHTNVKSAFNS